MSILYRIFRSHSHRPYFGCFQTSTKLTASLQSGPRTRSRASAEARLFFTHKQVWRRWKCHEINSIMVLPMKIYTSNTILLRSLIPTAWQQTNNLFLLDDHDFPMLWAKLIICLSKRSWWQVLSLSNTNHEKGARFFRSSSKVRKVRFWTAQRAKFDFRAGHGSLSTLSLGLWSLQCPLQSVESLLRYFARFCCAYFASQGLPWDEHFSFSVQHLEAWRSFVIPQFEVQRVEHHW